MTITHRLGRIAPEGSTPAKVLGLAASATSTWKAVTELYAHAKTHLGYTIAVTSDSELFWPVQRWVTEALPPSRARAMLAQLDYRKGADNLRLHYDGEREQFLRVEGHRVSVAVRTAGASDTRPDWVRFRPKEPDRVVVTAFTLAGRDAVNRLMKRLADEILSDQQALPDLYVWTKNGWAHSGDLHPRPLNTVHLAPRQMDRIITALDVFAGIEERYLALGLPWHIGFLFHGPPGTGKSSIARAMATHFRRNLYYLSLSSLESDETLFQAVASIRPNSMVLLEDVDTVRAMVDRRSADEGGVSMSAVLNVLDGVMTPHGLVKVLSTNDLGALDPAVYRSGRVDVVERIDFATAATANAIYRSAFGCDPGITEVPPNTKPAELVGAIKPYLEAPDEAKAALTALCAGDLTAEAVESQRPLAVSGRQDESCAVPDVAG